MARPVSGGHFAVLALDQACNGTGLKYLNKHIFSSKDSEISAAAALDPEASMRLDVAEGGPVDRVVPKFGPFPPGQGLPETIAEFGLPRPEQKILMRMEAEGQHPMQYLTKQYLTDGVGCWFKGGCGKEGVVYTRPSEAVYESVEALRAGKKGRSGSK